MIKGNYDGECRGYKIFYLNIMTVYLVHHLTSENPNVVGLGFKFPGWSTGGKPLMMRNMS